MKIGDRILVIPKDGKAFEGWIRFADSAVMTIDEGGGVAATLKYDAAANVWRLGNNPVTFAAMNQGATSATNGGKTMGGAISKGETIDRLQEINSLIRDAISALRETSPRWHETERAAEQALGKLDLLVTHITEAAEAFPQVGSLKYNPPIPAARPGGLGHRDLHNNHRNVPQASRGSVVNNNRPPEPLPGFKPPSQKYAVPKPIIPVKPPVVKKAPIVTPPPVARRLEETKTFDLSRMCGQDANHEANCRALQQGRVPEEVNWEMTESFDKLSKEQQERVIKKYRETGQPVTLSD